VTKGRGLPNVLIIGAQKAGTTSLFYWLSQHPDIFAPEHAKDFNAFFLNEKLYEKGVNEYSKVFNGWKDQSVILAGNVNYLYYPHIAKRIIDFDQNIKLIVLLRDPVERAKSAYQYAMQRGLDFRNFEEIINTEITKSDKLLWQTEISQKNYLEHGRYSNQLEKYFSLFKRKQIFIGLFEDMIDNPNLFLHEVFNFLELPQCDNIDTLKKNPTLGQARSNVIAKVLYSRNSLLRKALRPIISVIPNHLKFRMISIFSSLNSDNETKKIDLSKYNNILKEFYRTDVKHLQRIVDLDLSKWKNFKCKSL